MKKSLLLVAAILLGIFGFYSFQEAVNAKKERTIIGSVNEFIATYHYQPNGLNDSLSSKIFDLYIKRLDYSKNYFLRSDITALETYRYKIDEELKASEFSFFELSLEIITSRIAESKLICDSLLNKPFDFSKDESFEQDEEKRAFPTNKIERVDVWRKILKSHVAYRIYDQEKKYAKDRGNNDTVLVPTFDSLEVEARDYIKKKYDSRFSRLQQLDRSDRFSMYVNTFTNVSDPHTGYFPPKDKENFDISISGKLEGIGATLQEKDGSIKVTNIVPGSASWKQGELAAGDLILKVGQAEEEPVDIVGMRLDEAVRLIRGPKGTLVKLTVRKLEGEIAVIPIVRDIVIIEETYAKSTVITDDVYKKQIGYIYLPKFYVDFNNSNGRRCSNDILAEIKKLKKEKIDGLILDLRDNGGGSLSDVVTIGGFFIKNGPIVQVKSKHVAPRILSDKDDAIQYDGTLVIMVNQFSASASEILAAAMQDYDRAIVVGASSSYGKGTVQRFMQIDRFLSKENDDVKPVGDIKVTIQKFYRVNGGATQLKGVIPDVVLSNRYMYTEVGEKEHYYPMKWDEIPAVEYEKWYNPIDRKRVAKVNEKLLKSDTIFSLIEDVAKDLKRRNDETFKSLNYSVYKKQRSDAEPTEKMKSIGKQFTGLETVFEFEGKDETSKLDSVKRAGVERWHDDLKKDVELYHTYKLINEVL